MTSTKTKQHETDFEVALQGCSCHGLPLQMPQKGRTFYEATVIAGTKLNQRPGQAQDPVQGYLAMSQQDIAGRKHFGDGIGLVLTPPCSEVRPQKTARLGTLIRHKTNVK
jgi:hypothetical protein